LGRQCGNATDMAMESALINKAAYIMCPCCVGKLKFALEGGTSKSAAAVRKHRPKTLRRVSQTRGFPGLRCEPLTTAAIPLLIRALLVMRPRY